MEPARLVVLLLTCMLACTWDRACGRCMTVNFLSLCPNPVIVKPPQLNKLEIICVFTYSRLERMEMGVIRYAGENNNIWFYNMLQKDGPQGVPTRSKGRRTFVPEGEYIVRHNTTSMALTLLNATLSDLNNQWFCQVRWNLVRYTGTFSFDHKFFSFRSVPYPVNTTLTVSPAKPSHHSQELIDLQCTAIFSLNLSRITPRRLKYHFQYLHVDRWVTIHETDRLQTTGVVLGQLMTRGIYKLRIYTLKLMVSSIPQCTRRYRCLMSYESTSFEDEAPEVQVNVTTCTGGCIPPEGNETCVTEEASTTPTLPHTSATDGATVTSPVESTQTAGLGKPWKASSTRSFMIGGSVLGLVVLLILLILLVTFVRHQKRKKRRKSAKPFYQPEAIMVPQSAPFGLHPTRQPLVVGHAIQADATSDYTVSEYETSNYEPDYESYISYAQPTSTYTAATDTSGFSTSAIDDSASVAYRRPNQPVVHYLSRQ